MTENEFIKHYGSCSTFQQDLLMCMAVYPEDYGVRKVATRIGQVELPHKLKTEERVKAVREAKAELVKMGFLVQASGKGSLLPYEYANRILLENASERRYQRLIDSAFEEDIHQWLGVPYAITRLSYWTGRFNHLDFEDIQSLVDLLDVVREPFIAPHYGQLPDPYRHFLLPGLVDDALFNLWPFEAMEAYLAWEQEQGTLDAEESRQVARLRLSLYLMADQLDLAERYLEAEQLSNHQPWLLMLREDPEAARKAYDQCWAKAKAANPRKKHHHIPGIEGFIGLLTLLYSNELADRECIKQRCLAYSKQQQKCLQLKNLYQHLQTLLEQREVSWYMRPNNLLEVLFIPWMCRTLTTEGEPPGTTEMIPEAQQYMGENGYAWLAQEFSSLNNEGRSRLPVLPQSSRWERTLQEVDHLVEQRVNQGQTPEATEGARAAWIADLDEYRFDLYPVVQKRKKNGQFTKGQKIAMSRLSDGDLPACMSEQDRRAVIKGLARHPRYYGISQYALGEKTWLELIGHPYVFMRSDTENPVEVIASEPRLMTEAVNGLLKITAEPHPKEYIDEILIRKTGSHQVSVYHLKETDADILDTICSISYPKGAQQALAKTLGRVAGLFPVESDHLEIQEDALELPGDPTLYMQCDPSNENLGFSIRCRPFGADEGPYQVPGEGAARLPAMRDGRRCYALRALDEEQARMDQVLEKCPGMQQLTLMGSATWMAPDLENSLEVLLQLKELSEDLAVLQWPKGGALKLTHETGVSELALRVTSKKRDWFNLDGELKISEDQVVTLRHLIQSLSEAEGRFVKMEDGTWLALTQTLRQQIGEWKTLGELSNDTLELPQLANLTLDGLEKACAEFKATRAWKQRLNDYRSFEIDAVEIPRTLEADLRPYQEDGVRWMARLAHCGLGACLADDMGLGKTVQAIALLLMRAAEGPALVIAPTSVCHNWVAEIQRFAPTLNPVRFGDSDRQATLDQLKAFDVLVCSYGLMQSNIDLMKELPFETAILDEAQAIKNAATKRAKAALQLQAGFKIIATGTPIENHLGELHSLFQFLNPGLLGKARRFQERFIQPIEKHGDREVQKALARLISPFLLRRTKNEVLKDLPSRTTIDLCIEPSKAEAAFLEAIRQEALAQVTDAESKQVRMTILAQLMRLRRACCNPNMVQPELELPSAKFEQFQRLVEDLRENRHRALVFSQFVDHLSLLRAWLDETDTPYQYLDGSTPEKKRAKAVEAFQAGEGDLFLISLKAGGAGLNLTGADYVIHMDPWWNPAVEDQASDRAHRIGQTRPVTIYRLVMQNSVEEKVLALHRDKRDLADRIIGAAGKTGAISIDELKGLLETA